MTDPTTDPRHIYNARASHAAREAERDMYRAIEREVDPQPPNRIMDIIARALGDD